MSYKKRTKRVMQGRTRPEQYDSEEAALRAVKKLQEKCSYKFIVQHSVVHKDKWVIVEYWDCEEPTE